MPTSTDSPHCPYLAMDFLIIAAKLLISEKNTKFKSDFVILGPNVRVV